MARGARSVSLPASLGIPAAVAAQAAIGFYKRHLSPRSGRSCLFRESCSDFAIRMLQEEGWTKGMKAISMRLDRCGSSYSVSSDVFGRRTLTTVDGAEFCHEELAGCLHVDRGRPQRHR